MEDKRRFGRIPFGTQVNLQTLTDSYCGTLIDISLKGAKVGFADPAPLSEAATCRFILALADGITLEFNSVVMHNSTEFLGLKFIEADPESFSHLLRLMELNTGDAEKVEKELRDLCGK